jgi:hypothetical protein
MVKVTAHIVQAHGFRISEFMRSRANRDLSKKAKRIASKFGFRLQIKIEDRMPESKQTRNTLASGLEFIRRLSKIPMKLAFYDYIGNNPAKGGLAPGPTP